MPEFAERGKVMAKTPDNVELWKLTRGKIEHEDKWIQQRVSWNLASTSFLLAAYTVLLLSGQHVSPVVWLRRILLITIPLLGFAFSAFVIAGLLAAWIAERKAEREWHDLLDNPDSKASFPEIHSTGAALTLGKIASWGTTTVAVFVWISLLIASFPASLSPSIHPWR